MVSVGSSRLLMLTCPSGSEDSSRLGVGTRGVEGLRYGCTSSLTQAVVVSVVGLNVSVRRRGNGGRGGEAGGDVGTSRSIEAGGEGCVWVCGWG